MDNFTFGQFAELATYEDRREYEEWIDSMEREQGYRAVAVIGGWQVERFTHNRGWVKATGVVPTREEADYLISLEQRLDNMENA